MDKKYLQKRYNWVDIAKGLAIIAVVLGHIGFKWINTPLFPMRLLFIYLWHVPVFFMIGGFFIKKEKLDNPKTFIFGKFNNLYLKLIFIYIPVLLFHNVFLTIGFYDVDIEYFGKYVTWWGLLDYIKHIGLAIMCAGREPILGAMWFGFVLFMALCLLSLIYWTIGKLGHRLKNNTRDLLCGGVFCFLAILSCTLTRLFEFTIPRFNNTLVAIWLIWIGMLIFQQFKIEFSNGIIALICAMTAWHSATSVGWVSLVGNRYNDIITLTITTTACLYVVCYLSKKMEKVYWLRSIFSAIGRDSLYIMGFHLLGFKVAALILNIFCIETNLAILIPRIGGNIVMLFLYAFCGVGIPLLIIGIIRFIKKHLSCFKLVL